MRHGFTFELIESLQQLNNQIGGTPLKTNRFRPNIVVMGNPAIKPFAEDEWKAIKIGTTIFHPIKRCMLVHYRATTRRWFVSDSRLTGSRCKMTTINQEEGVSHGDEPLATLRQTRKQDLNVYFGQNLAHETHDGEVCVGDIVDVLERWPGGLSPPYPKINSSA